MTTRWLLLITLACLPTVVQGSCVYPPRVALTFDDGPHRTLTPRVLEALASHHAHATFFLVGNRIRANAGIVQAMHDEGHEVGTHTHDHAYLTRLASKAALRQILMGRDAVSSVLPGHEIPLWRAPYGAISPGILNDAEAAGLTHVSWTLDVRDYRPRPTLWNEIADQIVPGDIVLLHDIQPGTVNQLPFLLQSITDMGYQMVTVSELSSPQSCMPPAHAPVPVDMLEIDMGHLIP